MHLPPAQRGGPPHRAAPGGGGQRPGPVAVVPTTTTTTAPTVAGAPPPPTTARPQQLHRQQQHQHQQPPPPPPPPQHAPAAFAAAADDAWPQQQHQHQQHQHQRLGLLLTTTTTTEEGEALPPATAQPTPLSSFEQQQEAAPPRVIVAPLRVRRRAQRPTGVAALPPPPPSSSSSPPPPPPPPPPEHARRRPRSPVRQHQHQDQHHQHQRSHAALLAGLVVAVGAITALASYYPPAAFAAAGPGAIAAAAGGGGAASGSAAASLVAAATAAASSAATTATTTPKQSSSSSSSGPPVRLLAVVGVGARSPYAYSAPTADALRQQQKQELGGSTTATAAAPIPPPPLWSEAAPHLAARLALSNPRFRLEILREEDLIQAFDQGDEGAANAVLARAINNNNNNAPPVVALLAMGLTDPRTADLLSSPSSPAAAVGTLLSLPSSDSSDADTDSNNNHLQISQRAGFYDPTRADAFTRLLAERLPFTPQARAAKLLSDAKLLLSRRTSDDAVFAMLSVIHAYGGVSVPDVANAAQGAGPDLGLLICVFTHCREPVLSCVNDPSCKRTLDCLSNVPPNDQVASYRCIVAGESKLFTEFTKCVVLKHNCRGLTATTPTEPNPPPMRAFAGRGATLSHEVAEAVLFGHGVDPETAPASARSAALVPGTRPWAWRIAGGKNAAFDRFPAQHQLFYRTGNAAPGSKGGAVWYVPVFAVAPDGELLKEKVWRDRKYRVRRDDANDEPGRFVLTVSDNGATSREEWTLLDADDFSGGLEWALFYYRGSAPEAGMAYSGAVLATRDGEWPEGLESAERIERALRSAGIEPWELTKVDNSPGAVAGAPLPAHGGWAGGGGGGGGDGGAAASVAVA